MIRLLLLALLCQGLFLTSWTQPVCFTENFNTGTAAGWVLSNGANANSYSSPGSCQTNSGGIITPGVGGNNPVSIRTPQIVSNGATYIKLNFDIYRVSANLNCSSWADFVCPTTVQVVIRLNNTNVPFLSDLVLPQNGPAHSPTVSLIFNVQNQLPAGTPYQVELRFSRKATGAACVQNDTKYIIDNFSVCQPDPNEVVLNAVDDDLCSLASTTNVFEGDLRINDIAPAGADLSYTLVNGPYGNTNTVPGGADLVVNSNGTFNMVRTSASLTRFDFTYKVTDLSTGVSDLATCIVCFAEAGPLPVDWVSVNAFRKGNHVSVLWKTAMESQLRAFEIQRKIGNQFVTVGTVPPSNDVRGGSYSFQELFISSSIAEYRVRVVEQNGISKYSPVRAVAGLDASGMAWIYPNPSPGTAFILLPTSSGQMNVDLLDNTGSMIRQFRNVTGNQVTLSGLRSGIYWIKIADRSTGGVITKKLVVER